MAVIEEFDEEVERINDEKKRQEARRKAAVAAGGNLGPNGPSLEKAKPAFARGFLNPARPKGNPKQTDQGPIKDASSRSPLGNLSDQKQDKKQPEADANEGGRTPENVKPRAGSGEGEKRVGEANGEASVSTPEALENSKGESVKSTTAWSSKSASKGLAKGFLNILPKAASQTTGTGTSLLQHGKGPSLVDGSAQKTKVHGGSSASKMASDAEAGKEESLHAIGTADTAGGTSADIGSELRAEKMNNGLITEKVKAPMGMKLNGGARHLDLEDTWSVETQTSDTDKSELQEEVASAVSEKAQVTGSVPQISGEPELAREAPKDGSRGVVELGASGNAPETESQRLEESRSAVSMREESAGGELEEKHGQGSEEGKRGASVMEEQEGEIEEKGRMLTEIGGAKEEEGEKGGAGLQLAEEKGDKVEEMEGKGIEAMKMKEEQDDQKPGVGAEVKEREEAAGGAQKDAEKDGHEEDNGEVVQEEMGEKVASGEEGVVEDLEEEFHDACEDEEQQRKQALARAEEARARGNALYAVADYNGALEVYSQALELAPPAYITVEKPSIEDEKHPEAEESETHKGTNSGNVAEEGTGGGGSSSDHERLVSQEAGGKEGEGSSPSEGSGFRTGGARRVRPPKVRDPKTGKLVVPDGEGASGSERVSGRQVLEKRSLTNWLFSSRDPDTWTRFFGDSLPSP